ncbi:leukotoxin LktA family filamentous adhesin, partial [Hydrogenophaga sp.]
MSRLPSKAQRTTTSPQRQRLQTLVVRVGTLPMAAAMALGATVPWAVAQTVITPLSGPAATQTLVTRTPDRVTVTTGTLRDGNAFNNFSSFQVGAGDRVGLVVPQGANWLVNVVRDARVQVDGLLQGQLANGTVGGNLLFIDRHGFAVGPQGRVQAGRLVFAAPSSAFVDGLLADGPGLSSARVGGVLGGAFDRSDTGVVRIDGAIETTDGVQLMAGHGAGSAHAVAVSGQVSVAGRMAGSAVNLGDLRSLAPVVVRDGVIDITTPGDIVFNGKLLADGSHWNEAGAVRVVASGNIELGSASVVSASAGEGSGARGGTVSLFAHGSASNATGAALAARGDGVGAGGFIEFSAARSVQVGGLTLDASSDQGQAGLAYIDPEDLTVTGSLYTNGASLSMDASKTLKVNAGVTLNTRRVNGTTASSSGVSSAATLITSDPLTPSVGNSGNIILTAPSITVQAGATLDASVINQGGTTHEAGDIILTATQISTQQTLVSMTDANAGIDVAGTLTGRNVTLEASIESAASFGGTSGTIQQEAINLLLGDLPFAASLSYVEAKGNANITVRPTAVLAATENITLTALADRSVSVETEAAGSAKANLSAGFARVLGNTTIDVQGGASLTADGDIALVAASKTSVTMASSAAGETDEESGAANVASIVFAGSMSDVTTSVNVATGAALDSGGDSLLQAFHSGNYDTTAEVTVYGGGKAGVVGALSLQNSVTSVTVGGTVDAQGHVSLMAMNASAKNAITASATNASKKEEDSLVAGLPPSLEYSQDDAGEAAEAQLLDSFTAMTEEFSASSDEASGGTPSQTKSPALRLAGAMTWSQSSHTTRASLAAGGVINAGGDAVVDAQTLVGQLQSVAMAEATSETDDKNGTKTSLGVAFNYADHSFTTKALVGTGAAITADHVAVNASTDVPQFYTAGLPFVDGVPVEWGTFSTAYETFMAGTDPLYDGFNTRVGATSSATNLAAAGAVSLSFMTNDTRAWVDTGAQITSNVADGVAWSYDVREVGFESDLVAMLTPINTYTLDKDLGVLGDFVSETREAPRGPDVEEISFSRSFGAAVVVRAENHVQTLHLAGGTGPEAGGSGSSVGGTFSMVSRDNTAVAGIADSAVIQSHRLDVAAETIDWVLSLSPTSGQGAGVAANGIASLNKFSETTRASISREALVTAESVNLNAQLSLGVIAVTGAVTK